MEYTQLIAQARKAQKKAVAPYSNFKVGAALLTQKGHIYTGCNIEVSSYSLTICAERVALFKAISEGERSFETLAIVTDSVDFCPPCGACRQVLWEFGRDMKIVLVNAKGDYKVKLISELLPEAFDEGFLPDRLHK